VKQGSRRVRSVIPLEGMGGPFKLLLLEWGSSRL
jgi:hypothetical protein